MRPAQRRLLIFCREPVAGRVKTRLIPSLGPQRAATLYSRLLETALDAAYGVENASTELWCDFLRESSVVCRGLATRYAMTLCRQQGKDLGERMYHAISTSTPPGPALLIGSDCPEYTSEYLSDGFAALADKDAVIGPATDGGYVMIGVNRIDRHLFDGIPWGTDAVLARTRAHLRKLRWRWTELAPLSDVDRPSDLAHFPDLVPAVSTRQQGNET